MKLNYGCGEAKLEGYINIDIEESTKPDLIVDLRKAPFQYELNSIEEIICTHNLEHIEYKYHPQVLTEFWRVLIPNKGTLIVAYPEFEKCVKNFLTNHQGLKDFWRATLYGRQFYPGDYHVTPMITSDFVILLKNIGFINIKHGPEEGQEFNTFLVCEKGPKGRTHEDVLREEIFG